MNSLTLGQQVEVSYLVRETDTASALFPAEADQFPSVFATSRMIALMELAAARLLQPLLSAGQLSVGVEVVSTHTAATPVGTEVRAVATYEGMEGKLYRFNIEVFDTGGKIGTAKHTRAIVQTERLVAGAQKRAQPPTR